MLVGALLSYALLHVIVWVSEPSALFFAVVVSAGTVWVSNTVAHVHLHTPLFVDRRHNRWFSWALTAVTLVPQSVWRSRHLQHHAGRPATWPRASTKLSIELLLVMAVLTAHLVFRPELALGGLLPGLGLGLGLAAVQGEMEHRHGVGAGVSCYNALYNAVWFNDGFHAEHHARPRMHWTALPSLPVAAAQSRRAPLLRWSEDVIGEGLGLLERTAMRLPWVEGWLVRRHACAFIVLLKTLQPTSILVVGGGLFPRTLLALRALFPDACFSILDRSQDSLDCASRALGVRGVAMPKAVHASFTPQQAADMDLVVFPLAFSGRHAAIEETLIYARAVAVHDWLWTPACRSAVVSPWLLKRINLFLR